MYFVGICTKLLLQILVAFLCQAHAASDQLKVVTDFTSRPRQVHGKDHSSDFLPLFLPFFVFFLPFFFSSSTASWAACTCQLLFSSDNTLAKPKREQALRQAATGNNFWLLSTLQSLDYLPMLHCRNWKHMTCSAQKMPPSYLICISLSREKITSQKHAPSIKIKWWAAQGRRSTPRLICCCSQTYINIKLGRLLLTFNSASTCRMRSSLLLLGSTCVFKTKNVHVLLVGFSLLNFVQPIHQ